MKINKRAIIANKKSENTISVVIIDDVSAKELEFERYSEVRKLYRKLKKLYEDGTSKSADLV